MHIVCVVLIIIVPFKLFEFHAGHEHKIFSCNCGTRQFDIADALNITRLEVLKLMSINAMLQNIKMYNDY